MLNQCKIMASATITLDTRSRKKDGTYPLKVTISHHNATARIPLGISIPRADWDSTRRRCTGASRHHQTYVTQRLAEVQSAMLQVRDTGRAKTMTATELRDAVLQILNPTDAPTFGTWFEKFAMRHDNARTRAIYLATLHLIRLHDKNALNAKFEDINRDWLETFFHSLARRSPSVNARNIHLRNIRAVFNDAIDNGVTSAYPFRRMRIRPQPTPKRSMPAADLRAILTASSHNRYLDAFRLSFYLIGMNMADLLALTPSDITDGRIIYTRRKTHRLYSLKIPPEAQAIIDRHRGGRLLLDFAERCADYRHFANKANIYLHTIRKGLTMYWARHTWATVAASLDIPDDIISLALGHSARNATTDIYIRRDLKKVDDANAKVIAFVLSESEK